MEAEKAIEEENKSRPATSEGAIVTVEEEFEVRAPVSCDSSPSDEAVGALFFDFGPIRTKATGRRDAPGSKTTAWILGWV